MVYLIKEVLHEREEKEQKEKQKSKGSSQKFAHCGQTKELSYGTLPPPPSSNESVIDNFFLSSPL